MSSAPRVAPAIESQLDAALLRCKSVKVGEAGRWGHHETEAGNSMAIYERWQSLSRPFSGRPVINLPITGYGRRVSKQAVFDIAVGARTIPARRGKPLLNELLNANVLVRTACLGKGVCHLCRVRVLAGDVPPPAAVEKQALGRLAVVTGVRLSCHITIDGPLRIEIVTD